MNTGIHLIDKAFSIGMTQVPEEITYLIAFLNKHELHNSIEIGSKLGGTYYIWCNMIYGKKISIDIQGGDFGGWMINDHIYLGDVYNKRNEYFESTFKDAYMIDGNSQHFNTYKQVREILIDEGVDLLFLDGDHSYEGVKSDYLTYCGLVNKGGFIVFHDINDTEHHREIGCNVAKLWNELEGDKIEFNANKHWAGIGVLRV